LLGEAVGVAFTGVDGDRDRTRKGLSARDPAAGVGGAGGLLRLPEDRLATLDLGKDELGAGKPGTVEHQVDRRSAPAAEPDRCLLDDFRILRPCLLEEVAVDARGRRPRLPRFQHQPVLERQPQQVWQPAIGLRVAGNQEGPTAVAHAAAA
jgi:hypothetical protein